MPRYRSKARKLKIVMKRSYRKEVEGETIFVPGHRIEFDNNVYETDDKEEIKFLDEDCKNMRNRGVFIKVEDETLEQAKTKEEKKKEEEEAKKKAEVKKKKPTTKEKGAKTKVDVEKDKPEF